MKLSLNVNWKALELDLCFLQQEFTEGYLNFLREKIDKVGLVELDGEVRDGRPHGVVTIHMVGATVHINCEDGVPSKNLWITFHNLIIFGGEFPQGEGEMFFPNDTMYKGNMKDFKPHGEGTFFINNGGSVEGIWNNGVLEGLVTLTDIDGNVTTINYETEE